MTRKLYLFWTGDNPLSDHYERSLESMTNTGLEPVLITGRNLHDVVPKDRLHPAYPYLNLAHRADYLRCYVMKHHGGAYSDLKYPPTSWIPAFDALESDPDAWASGYRETSPRGVADLYMSSRQLKEGLIANIQAQVRWRRLQWHYKTLIGTCAFIFKPNTPLVDAWWQALNERLDALHPRLERHPANYPKEQPGAVYEGERSRYPVPWTYLLGDILHPLAFRYSEHLRYDVPKPIRLELFNEVQTKTSSTLANLSSETQRYHPQVGGKAPDDEHP